MLEIQKNKKNWSSLRVGITGARGSLGLALIKEIKSKGAYVIGLSHSKASAKDEKENTPNEWINWECGQEQKLEKTLATLDILILNHGTNPKSKINNKDLNAALEINALSTWRILQIFEKIVLNQSQAKVAREIWVNTSEAEIQPALSPSYEISKRLIGQLVSLKSYSIQRNHNSKLIIRKLILGPFRSNLNPIGLMNPNLVSTQIINQVNLNFKLIIVTPNPLTYLLMPLNELLRYIYFNIFSDEI